MVSTSTRQDPPAPPHTPSVLYYLLPPHQASFDPPGITVSVKKDRAMGQLLVVGGKFAVSMVAEGRDRPVMKRLTKPFSPGEDRLAGEEGEVLRGLVGGRKGGV